MVRLSGVIHSSTTAFIGEDLMRASTNVYLYFGFDFHAKPYTLPEFLQGQDRGGWETYYALL